MRCAQCNRVYGKFARFTGFYDNVTAIVDAWWMAHAKKSWTNVHKLKSKRKLCVGLFVFCRFRRLIRKLFWIIFVLHFLREMRWHHVSFSSVHPFSTALLTFICVLFMSQFFTIVWFQCEMRWLLFFFTVRFHFFSPDRCSILVLLLCRICTCTL